VLVWPCSTVPLSVARVFARCIGGGEELPFEQILIAGKAPEACVRCYEKTYAQEAIAQAERPKASHPQLRVHVFRNSLVGADARLVGDW